MIRARKISDGYWIIERDGKRVGTATQAMSGRYMAKLGPSGTDNRSLGCGYTLKRAIAKIEQAAAQQAAR